MKQEKINRDKWLHVRLTSREYSKLTKGFSSSTKRRFSDYVRDILLDKPITVYTRDKTMDEAMKILGDLKQELNALGNNFNQAVKRLHSTIETEALIREAKSARQSYIRFEEKVAELNTRVKEIFKKWLQE